MTTPPLSRSFDPDEVRNRVTIGIIAALASEGAEVTGLLRDSRDFRYNGDPQPYRVGTLVSVLPENPHHVALTVLLQDGTRYAASACSDMLRTFPNVDCVILTGIAGGIPRRDRPDHHVRLGDIVVATEGVLDYRYVNRENARERPRRWGEGGISARLRYALVELGMRAQAGGTGWERWLDPDVTAAAARHPRPGPGYDRLTADGRPVSHPSEHASGHLPGRPKVHKGLVASGDVLMRDEEERDRLAAAYPSLRALEMEASGITAATAAHDIHWFMVRGISDYCDNEKNDVWHGYASYVAAGYVCALLEACAPVLVRPLLPLPARDRLNELFLRLPVGVDLRAVWAETAPEIAFPPSGADATARQAFDYLTQWNSAGNGLSPALKFIDGLARDKAAADIAAELLQWVDGQARSAQLDRALQMWRERPLPRPPANPAGPCLLIEIEPLGHDREQFRVSSYIQEQAGEWLPRRGPACDTPVRWDALGVKVPALVDDAEAEQPWGRGVRPAVEFLLPAGLMNLPMEWWCPPSQRDIPLCVDYEVAIRSLDRMRHNARPRFWEDRWNTMSHGSTAHPYSATNPEDDAGLHAWAVGLRDDRAASCVVLSGPAEGRPGRDQLDQALRAGVPVILWDRRSELAPEGRESLDRLASEAGRELPQRVKELRADAARLLAERRRAHDGSHVALLWDDPTRLVPPKAEP